MKTDSNISRRFKVQGRIVLLVNRVIEDGKLTTTTSVLNNIAVTFLEA
ncbi:hypothetical protein SOVF_103720 [Spinacia oleracea]|nr:hypothetical protein SOVF_103720 [Spinacia oleracea]